MAARKFSGCQDVAMPSPAADEVLIKVVYAAINALNGNFARAWVSSLGLTSHCLSCWDVKSRGPSNPLVPMFHDFKVDDDVFGFVDVRRSGGYAEYITAKASEIALKPQSIDFAHAATIPVGALTSWQACLKRQTCKTDKPL
jgi:NADPH:quinone reductase-like Zn-dependent oxidoreductase